jgi:hypothetical protein
MRCQVRAASKVEGQRRGCCRQGADRALAFCSGMAALSAVLRLVASGEHVVAGDDIYGGTSRLLAQVAPFVSGLPALQPPLVGVSWSVKMLGSPGSY